MQPAITRLTATEFMAIESDYPFIRELLDGEIVLTNSPVPKHNDIISNALFMLKPILPNGKLVFAPMGLILTDTDVPQPDLFWVMDGGTCRQGADGYYGAPALIIEVLSPSTAKKDRKYKFRLYESVGVQEYWIVDPIQELIEVWSLVNGHYSQVGIFDVTETLEQSVIDKPVSFATLFD